MENHLYVCEYCSVAYKPKKRGTQKYCSASCKASAWKKRQKVKKGQTDNIKHQESSNQSIEYENTINAAGIGNVVVGTTLVNTAQHFLTHPENRPATKGDIRELLTSIQVRYKPVLNMNLKPDGSRPYYDEERQVVVYMISN